MGWAELKSAFLAQLQAFGFTRDTTLEAACREPNLSDDERSRREQQLITSYVGKIQHLPHQDRGTSPRLIAMSGGFSVTGVSAALGVLLASTGLRMSAVILFERGMALLAQMANGERWFADGREGVTAPWHSTGQRVSGGILHQLTVQDRRACSIYSLVVGELPLGVGVLHETFTEVGMKMNAFKYPKPEPERASFTPTGRITEFTLVTRQILHALVPEVDQLMKNPRWAAELQRSEIYRTVVDMLDPLYRLADRPGDESGRYQIFNEIILRPRRIIAAIIGEQAAPEGLPAKAADYLRRLQTALQSGGPALWAKLPEVIEQHIFDSQLRQALGSEDDEPATDQ